jgi:hypothetical protein
MDGSRMSRTVIQVEGLGKRYRIGQANGHALRLSPMLQNATAFQWVGIENQGRGVRNEA